MNLVQWLEQIMVGFGAGWVLWLMIGLSVISVAIILERAWFFHSMRDDLSVLAEDLSKALDSSIQAARARMERSPSAEAAVVIAGLAMHDKGAAAAEEAMDGAAALQRTRLEKRLSYLATLGNNAPFIGLFGTVIGVMGAFKELGKPQVAAAGETMEAVVNRSVMGEISEALVATAVGIAVAIPAVAANNYFQRSSKQTLANTQALSKVLLAHMKSTHSPSDDDDAPSEAKASESKNKSRRSKKSGAAKKASGSDSDSSAEGAED